MDCWWTMAVSVLSISSFLSLAEIHERTCERASVMNDTNTMWSHRYLHHLPSFYPHHYHHLHFCSSFTWILFFFFHILPNFCISLVHFHIFFFLNQMVVFIIVLLYLRDVLMPLCCCCILRFLYTLL